MPRAKNTTLKYNLSVNCNGTQLHNSDYCSLREVAEHLNFPYTTITDIYEGRRKSMNKYAECKYFPSINITKLSSPPSLGDIP